MGSRRLARGWTLVAAWRCFSLSAVALSPETAAERPFLRDHPVLQFIEQKLPASATIVVPPDVAEGKHVVTDVELRAVFAGVLDDFLAPPSTFASKAGDLIGEVCRYRPAQTALWIAVAADSILQHALPSAGKELDDAVAAAVAANPREAGAVVRQTIRCLAAGLDAGAFRAAGRFDRTVAARNAGRIVLTAIDSVKTAPLIRDILKQALEEALAQRANDLVVETMAAAVKGGRDVEGARVGDLAKLAFSKYGRTKLLAGIICAGVIKGSGPEAASAIKDEAALNLPVPFAAYTNIVCNAYATAAAAPQEAASEIARFITVTNADYIPAAMIGAIVAAPRAAAEILQAGLNRDLVLHGRATTREIVEAAVMACEQSAPELAAAAVGHGDLQEGNAPAQIAEGVARGAPATRLGAALAAQLRVQEESPAAVRASVAGAIAGAIAGEKTPALCAITFAAAADPRFANDVLDQVMISTPPELQYAGVLGVLAARPEQASALLDRARKNSDRERTQVGPFSAGGAVIIAIQSDPSSCFRTPARWLREINRVSPGTAIARRQEAVLATELAERWGRSEASPGKMEAMAIVLGASLANPRGAPAVAAAAAVATDVAAESLLAAAIQGDPGAAVRIAQAVETAIHVKGEAGDLFQSVRRQIAATPDLAPEIVTGAMAAAPTQGHVIGHAAAVAAPAWVAQMVPRLFAFSPEGDSAETFAGLTGGVVRGVVEANLDPASESDAIAEAVAASLRSVIALNRGRAAGAGALPEGEGLAAVVTAATQAARGHAVEIAQVAARTARALFGSAADQAMIRNAVLAAAPRAEAAKIADALAAGIADAELLVPAVGAKTLLDYAHDSLTGRPMTSFHDL